SQCCSVAGTRESGGTLSVAILTTTEVTLALDGRPSSRLFFPRHSFSSFPITTNKELSMKRFKPLALCAGFAAFSASAAQAQDCDRACLQDTLDKYLNAVVQHDPSAAPLAIGVRQTENAINVAPGKGTWQSVTAL